MASLDPGRDRFEARLPLQLSLAALAFAGAGDGHDLFESRAPKAPVALHFCLYVRSSRRAQSLRWYRYGDFMREVIDSQARVNC
jgi:hypothetical protein